MRFAFLGPVGTYGEQATRHLAELEGIAHPELVPQLGIRAVVQALAQGTCDAAVVPVENSTEGMVSHTLDSFMDSPLKIAGEVEMRIGHHLLAAAHTPVESVVRICAHQQALAQCRSWLDRHWPDVEREAVSSNGEAARLAEARDDMRPELIQAADELDQLAEAIKSGLRDSSAPSTTRTAAMSRITRVVQMLDGNFHRLSSGVITHR